VPSSTLAGKTRRCRCEIGLYLRRGPIDPTEVENMREHSPTQQTVYANAGHSAARNLLLGVYDPSTERTFQMKRQGGSEVKA